MRQAVSFPCTSDICANVFSPFTDTFVYLFPQSSGKGPSFRLHSDIFTSSATLTHLAYGNLYSGRKSNDNQHSRQESGNNPTTSPPPRQRVLTDNSSSSSSKGTRHAGESFDEPPSQINLHVPILSAHGALSSSNPGDGNVTEEDVESLIQARNMFAFLIGQSLVATERRSTAFSVFLRISESLKTYGFTNLDGSTFGERAATSFDEYVDEFGLGDVRMSREQTVEGVVLGERMRSVLLYNEAFVHAVGKYGDILDVCKRDEPQKKFDLISPVTKNRMERAHIDLAAREKGVNHRLVDFEFPSLFAGIMSSKTNDARKTIQFGAWKESFFATRRHVLGYYKQKFGSWPPKASSKKNDLEISGLNRLVLLSLYRDFADLYDLFVDRSSLTTRSNNDMLADEFIDDMENEEPTNKVLRRVFDEYDRSSPPVQPPVPYDTPLLPMMAAHHLSFTGDVKQDAKVRAKKMKEDEAGRLLDAATNRDVIEKRLKHSPFLGSMRGFERQRGKGCTIQQLTDNRAGVWMFLYAVLQALPMLVVDAPAIKYSQGVEYFLCEPPRSGVPWAAPDTSIGQGRSSRNWYGVSGGQGVISLPSDLVEHGVEGVYRRSHCWQRAAEWSGGMDRVGMFGGGFVEEPQSSPGAAEVSGDVPTSPERNLNRMAPPPIITGGHPSTLPNPALSSHSLRPPSSAGAASRASSPHTPGSGSRSASRTGRESVMQLGLEALPLPANVSPAGAQHPPRESSLSRPTTATTPHSRNTSGGGMTFDDIIAGMDNQGKKKPKRKSLMTK